MDGKAKARAIEPLVAEKGSPSPTHADTERKTGYGRRRPIRISKRIDERGAGAAAGRGDAGRKPAATATEGGLRCLRGSKSPAAPLRWPGSGTYSPRARPTTPIGAATSGAAVPRRGAGPGSASRSGAGAGSRPRGSPGGRAPEAAHPDEHPVFRSARAGTATQPATMPGDLGVRTMFANAPQAEGRVGRHNPTGRPRPANDVVRFGIEGHDRTDAWFDESRIDCPNGRFPFPPAESASEFSPPPEDFGCSSVFRIGPTRTSRNGMISYETGLYRMADGNGEPCDPGEGVKVSPFIDVWTEEMHVGRCSKRYRCVPCGVREHKKAELVGNQKELQDLLREDAQMTPRGA